jgi:hypothetical protein
VLDPPPLYEDDQDGVYDRNNTGVPAYLVGDNIHHNNALEIGDDDDEPSTSCPICQVHFPLSLIQEHADQCSAQLDTTPASRPSVRGRNSRFSAAQPDDPPRVSSPMSSFSLFLFIKKT